MTMTTAIQPIESVPADMTRPLYIDKIKRAYARSQGAEALWQKAGRERLVSKWEAGRAVEHLYNWTVVLKQPLMPFWDDLAAESGASTDWLRQAKELAEVFGTRDEVIQFSDEQAARDHAGIRKVRKRLTVAERQALVEAEKAAAIKAALEAAAKRDELAPPTLAEEVEAPDGTTLRRGLPVPTPDPIDVIDDGDDDTGVVDRLQEVAEILESIDALSTEDDKAAFSLVLDQIERLRGIA
jgi:hypothetical protein